MWRVLLVLLLRIGIIQAFIGVSKNRQQIMTTTTTRLSGSTGFIGLGIMGDGMAARLVTQQIAGTSDHPLVIWNRTGSKSIEFQSRFPNANIIIKDTPKQVVETCEIVYSMLSTPEASRAVFHEPVDGVLAGVTPGVAIVDCATLAELDMQQMDIAVTHKGGRFLEAPVSGSKIPAETGTLIFLCAGSRELFDQVHETGLAAMGKASHFFSNQVGAGTRAKLVVNSLMGTMLAAYGEALALSESVGLEPSKIIEVIGQGAIAAPMFALKGPKMIQGDHSPNFPLKHAHKDMALASAMAKEAGVEFSVMNEAEHLFRLANDDSDLDIADKDFTAVYEKIHKESTSEVSKKRNT